MNESIGNKITRQHREKTGRELTVLGHHLTANDIDVVALQLSDAVTQEVLLIASVLNVLANTTNDHSNELEADGFILRAEEARNRAEGYSATFLAILEIWEKC